MRAGRKVLGGLLACAAMVYLAGCAVMYTAQDTLLYHPTPETDAPGAESLSFDTGGATLRIWREGPGQGEAIIYFGGNGEDVAGTLPFFHELFPGRPLYFVNYRGYGGSSGKPSQEALTHDALAVYDRVRASHPQVCVIGRSLGTGVAVYVASRRDVKKLVLVTPYDSIETVARHYYGLLPVSWLLRDKFPSSQWAHDVKAPVLAILAGHDEVIPREDSEALVAVFAKPQIRVVNLPEAGHNTVQDFQAYGQAIKSFL